MDDRRARQRFRKSRWWNRALAVFTLVLVGIASGTVIAEAATRNGTECDLNSVYGHTQNNTDAKVDASETTHGVTNEWCKAPARSVGARGRNDWLAGDNFFETHVKISYRFPDGVVANFNAESRAFTSDRITAGCSVSPAGGRPAGYACYTRTAYFGGSHGEVDFVLVPVTPGGS
jgi:hypothetical protein